MKYKLDVARDVDTDGPNVFILNLPAGWKFDHDVYSLEHVRGYDSMKELRADIKSWVVPCDCAECKQMTEVNMQARYEIYVACAEALGWPIKTYEEWLNS